MIVLGIETSCDETSVSVVKDGWEVLSNVIYSQIEIHKAYGGVVPEIASRNHVLKIQSVYEEAISIANIQPENIDKIAVTFGPGLVGALLVGVSFAKGLSYALKKPLVGVNHIHGHIYANLIGNKDLKPPFISLVVSGGHSHLVKVISHSKLEVLGGTRDDAAGEAFDKIARVLGLGYPGGPLIDNEAKNGDNRAISFPRISMKDAPYDFSFSGLKTAVLNYVNQKKQKQEAYIIADVCASFQEAIVDVLVDKAIKACKENMIDTLCLSGGVGANSRLRERMSNASELNDILFNVPSRVYCTDNAAMIATRAYYLDLKDSAQLSLNATANLRIGMMDGIFTKD